MNWSDFSSAETQPEPVLRMVINTHISAVNECGKNSEGLLMNYIIGGGEFIARAPDGREIRGCVLPGGADYFRERPDGIGVLNAMYSLQSDYGQVFNISNTGLYVSNAEGRKLETQCIWPLPQGFYRSACRPVFSAPDGELSWLNDSVFTGLVSYPSADSVIIRVFELIE